MVEHDGSKVLENDKHEMFAQHYVVSNSQVESAKKAGYKGNGISVQASRLIKNPKISARINYLRKQALDAVMDEQVDVMRELVDILQTETSNNTRLKALEMVAKIQGLFIERREVKSEVNVNDMSNISDDELDKMLKQYEEEDEQLTN